MLRRVIVGIIVLSGATSAGLAQDGLEHAELYRQAILGIDEARPGLALDVNPLVRQEAAWVVGGFDTPRARTVLNRLLADPNVLVRAEAVKALARHPQPDTLERLRQYATDKHPAVRRGALAALRHCGTPEQAPIYLAALEDDDPVVRRQAVACLARHGSPTGDARLARVLSSGDDMLRLQVLRGLAYVRDGRLADVVRPLVRHKRFDFRGLALVVLSGDRSLDGDALAMVVGPGLADPHPYVRRMALECLFARLGDKSLDHVLQMARDEDAAVREVAMEMLGTIADRRSRAELRLHLDDPYKHVRVQASRSLAAVMDLAYARKLHREDITLDVAADADETDKAFNRVNMALRSLGLAQYTPADADIRKLVRQSPNNVVKTSGVFAVAEMNRTDTPARPWRKPDPTDAGAWLLKMIPRGPNFNTWTYEVQETAIVGLAKLRYRDALPTLRAIANSMNEMEIRMMVADVARRVVEGEGLDEMARALPEATTGYPALTRVWRPVRASRPVASDPTVFREEVKRIVPTDTNR